MVVRGGCWVVVVSCTSGEDGLGVGAADVLEVLVPTEGATDELLGVGGADFCQLTLGGLPTTTTAVCDDCGGTTATGASPITEDVGTDGSAGNLMNTAAL